jgi:YegS/Rv2252/BmrU family lipid kinase
MRAAVIVNPGSGHIRTRTPGGETRVSLAQRLVTSHGLTVDVVATTAAGHARELAASFAAREYDRVVAWGGDGTVNEVAGPLISTRTALGIVSAGSGNGFAHSVGLPRDPAAALKTALTAPAAAVDIGMMGHRHFLNVAGVGFDAAVAIRYDKRPTRGTATYAVESLSGVWSYRCETYEVRAGDQAFEGPLFLVAFANGREYGSGIVMAPNASVTDGQLDMVIVSGGGPLQQFWRSRRLWMRRLAPARGLWRGRITSAGIRGDRLVCHVDGETFETSGDLNVVIVPGALMVAGVSE